MLPEKVKSVLEELLGYVKLLVHHHIILGYGGNISFRVLPKGDLILITRHGTLLELLEPKDFVPVRLSEERCKEASIEYPTHRLIYLKTNMNVVFHVHSTPAIVLSLRHKEGDVIKPLDEEGRLLINEIPIVEAPAGTMELAEKIVRWVIKGRNVVLARGHGIFVAEKDVRRAYIKTCAAERSLRILVLAKILGALEGATS